MVLSFVLSLSLTHNTVTVNGSGDDQGSLIKVLVAKEKEERLQLPCSSTKSSNENPSFSLSPEFAFLNKRQRCTLSSVLGFQLLISNRLTTPSVNCHSVPFFFFLPSISSADYLLPASSFFLFFSSLSSFELSPFLPPPPLL